MEDSENVSGVPEWKVDLCKRRVKYMMVEEDEAINESSVANSPIRFRK